MEESVPTNLWSHHGVNAPIGPSRIAYEDVKRLFDIIESKQQEEAKEILSLLAQQPSETEEQFAARRIRVRNAYVTLVTIGAANGEAITGSDRTIFDSPMVPDRILSILMDTANGPKSINVTPRNWVSLFLDFGQPPVINLGVMPSAPTANGSNYRISASSESWATSLNSRIREYFNDRKTAYTWLHQRGCYDALVILLGLPLALWCCFRLSNILPSSGGPAILISAVYVYTFFLTLILFRAFFDYTR
jgi:hypothetical protein